MASKGLLRHTNLATTRHYIHDVPENTLSAMELLENCATSVQRNRLQGRTKPLKTMAGTTGLEPATSAVTGQRSNQLNYVPRVTDRIAGWWAVTDLNRGPSRCKRDALTAELTALDRIHPNRS